MNGLAVGQQYNTKRASVHLIDARPAADASVLLHNLFFGVFDHPLNPLHLDHGPVRSLPHGHEISGELHAPIVGLAGLNSREKVRMRSPHPYRHRKPDFPGSRSPRKAFEQEGAEGAEISFLISKISLLTLFAPVKNSWIAVARRPSSPTLRDSTRQERGV